MKNRKRFFALLLSAALMLSVTACGGKSGGSDASAGSSPAAPGTSAPAGEQIAEELIVLVGADASTFDPHFCTDSATEIFNKNMYNGLVKFNSDMEILPDLAKDWSVSEDGLTWTFNLRDDVAFHDGTKFNAEAVKVCLDRIRNPDVGSPVRTSLEPIATVEVVSEYVVSLSTEVPDGAMLQRLAGPAAFMISPAAIEKYGADLGANPVGTGPFKYVEWKVGEELVMERYENYHDGAPMVQKVIFRVVPEDATRALLIQSKQADVAMRLPATEVNRLKASGGINFVEGETVMTMYVALNNSKGVLQNVKVRQAMNYAVDKNVIVNDILGGMATVADAPISPKTWGYSSTKTYERDLAKAKALLTEAGYPDGIDLELWTPTGRYLMDVQVSENLQAQWAEAGIRVNIRQWEFQSLMSEVKKGEFDMVLLGWSPSTGDADVGLYRPLHSSQFPPNSNRAFYNNPTVDKYLEDAKVEVNLEKRAELYAKAQEIIMDEAPWVFLYYPKQALAVRENVSGISILPTEHIILEDVRKG